jgi:hypothetical protein
MVMPARLRPGVPWQLGAFVIVAALMMIAANGAVARAWIQWRRR